MPNRNQRFFENLTPLAKALGAVCDANHTQPPAVGKEGRSIDAWAEREEKRLAKLARRAKAAGHAPKEQP